MLYSPINVRVWKWKLEREKTASREQKPKVSWNYNGSWGKPPQRSS